MTARLLQFSKGSRSLVESTTHRFGISIGGYLENSTQLTSSRLRRFPTEEVRWISTSASLPSQMRAIELVSFGSRTRNIVDTMDHSVGLLGDKSDATTETPDPVFRVSELELPEPSGTEVLIEVHATSVNPIDCMIARGYGKTTFQHLRSEEYRNFGLGRDFSGRIVGLGSSTWDFRMGDEVFGALHPLAKLGSYSQYIIARQDQIALKPKSLTHAQAASLPYGALTAWQSFLEPVFEKIPPGETIFIHGGSGAIGSFAIQAAKLKGYRVISSCSRRNIDLVLSFGADLVIDYRQPQLIDEDSSSSSSSSFYFSSSPNSRQLIRGVPRGSVAAVLDVIGTESTQQFSFAILRQPPPNASSFSSFPTGIYVTLRPPLIPLLDKHGLVLGLVHSLGNILTEQATPPTPRWGIFSDLTNNSLVLEEIATLFDRHSFKPHIDTIWSTPSQLEEVTFQQAHTLLESGKACGKVVIQLERKME